MSDKPVPAKIMPYTTYSTCAWCGATLAQVTRYLRYVGLCPKCHAMAKASAEPTQPRRTDGMEIQWREIRPGVLEGVGYRHRFRVYTAKYGAGLHLADGIDTPIGNFRDTDAAKAIAQATADLWNKADIRP